MTSEVDFLKRSYKSFTEFEKTLDKYQKKSCCVFRKKSTDTVGKRNLKTEAQIPDGFRYARCFYVCTHFGHPVYRGKGVKSKTKHSATGCEAKFTLNFDYSEAVLRIKKWNLIHNHPTTPETFSREYKVKRLTIRQSEELKRIMAPHILIGCTGSVASIKIPELLEGLQQIEPKPEIRLVTTDNALHFFNKDQVSVHVYTDKDEWETWSSREDPVLHIELRKWVDVMLIAPLGANTLGKIAGGLCDNLLTCIVRAWDRSKPLLFAPAMNTHMWDHPITSEHIEKLKSYGYTEVPCIAKKLACGDIGYGAMAEVPTLVSAVQEVLQKQCSSSGANNGSCSNGS